MAYEISEIKKIGIGLVGFGILFSFLGVILFFDRGLLALGNIFFLTGVGLLLGWQSMWQLFTKKANIKVLNIWIDTWRYPSASSYLKL
uniref:Vesicle transport protein GOT1A n=1 Tax=Triticum urartu TaxID=4572 RepID=A0A8R7QQX3_TRIUA